MRSWIVAFAAVGMFMPACGCGGPKTVPVKGVVTIDGATLANVSVTFNAQDPGGKDAHGSTSADGSFHLSTFRPKDGALPGQYKITVHYSDPVNVSPNLKSAADVQQAMVNAPVKRPSVILPPTYTQTDQTILKHKVPDDGDVKLELRTK